MQPRSLQTSHNYIKFLLSPACTDALTVRKALQDALLQSFGLVSANTYLDVLWLAEDGKETIVRVGMNEATKVMAAVTASTGTPRLSTLKDSPLLPALLASGQFPR